MRKPLVYRLWAKLVGTAVQIEMIPGGGTACGDGVRPCDPFGSSNYTLNAKFRRADPVNQ
ncbi:MAG TPA: hypothetical protein PLD25_05635 [Chloroflexota bacterium]|nr:hypothetical protein [Chloroflexota bacterium]HUM69290.1 hypothetical protein [Chloroflexota bacterium]